VEWQRGAGCGVVVVVGAGQVPPIYQLPLVAGFSSLCKYFLCRLS
jgi:hypothetical protein